MGASRGGAASRDRASRGGAIGLQLLGRDFAALGDEAFVPPTETDACALFDFEELDLGRLRLQFGSRYERGEVAATVDDLPALSFDAFSASAGLIWLPREGTAVSLSVARSARIPTAEQLFSDGPHLATNSFEIGDSELGLESSLGVYLGVRSLGRSADRRGERLREPFRRLHLRGLHGGGRGRPRRDPPHAGGRPLYGMWLRCRGGT
ncbi:MAG TPA: TonB-dependent receptor [Gemmatimonadota bacterium]|nr:TonB-dependent receptor [Gemmatimonadota bacterium]